jgi:prepilin signal peptidase PulO-like enzyme (type II secretory pathway)
MVGLFLISYVAWPFAWDAAGVLLFCFWLVFLVGFVALVIYDLKWMELPNRIVYPLIILAAVHVIFMAITGSISGALADAFWGFLFIGGLFYALFQISGGKWIGGGDVKLSFMIGLLVGGPAGSLMVVFFASFIGTVISLPLMAMRLVKPSSRIPFGPFLLAATVVVYLSGERLVDAYLSLF